MLGPGTEFRDGQWEAINHVANQRQRLLVVQRIGWGKSSVYFLATKILREAGAGPTLLISPLLSLMRNQLLATEKLGVRAATMHSENVQDWCGVEAALASNQLDLLMVSPERLALAIVRRMLSCLFRCGRVCDSHLPLVPGAWTVTVCLSASGASHCPCTCVWQGRSAVGLVVPFRLTRPRTTGFGV